MCVAPFLPEGAAAAGAAAVVAEADDSGGVNTPPVAVDDAYAINDHQQLGANVLANDTDAEGDALSVVLLSGPSHGTLTLDAGGPFTYTPDRRFDGVDTFTYRLSDGEADSNAATVSISVAHLNDPPVALPDSYRTDQDQPLAVSVESGLLANDRDPNDDPLTASLVDGPENGTLTLHADGSLEYVPNPGFHGADGFTYVANDGQADSPAAAVTLTVGSTNDPPAAADDAYRVDEDQVLSVTGPGVLANDADGNGESLSAILVTGPRSGTLVLGADGSFDYTPNANFHGTDAFTYRANDGQADSQLGAVAITVDSVNDAPQAADDAYGTDQGQTLTVATSGVLANDQDAEGDPLTAALIQGPASGTVTLSADGSFQYTPNPGFYGTDSFTYTANDGQADSSPATVAITVNAVNTAPTAGDDSYTTPQDQPLSVPAGGVLANDQDADGDPLTAAAVEGPANGTLALGADGSFQYTPNAGFYGTDAFTYTANDGEADSNPATVTITVDPAQSPPAKELKVHLEVSGAAFGPDAGPIWGGSTFWVSAYVEDLRAVPQGVVGGAIDLEFDSSSVTPTGNVAYGDQFTDYRQGTVDAAAGLIDEAGALATEGGVGAHGAAPLVAWEFRRSGPGAPDDPNRPLVFAADPGEGTATILPANFALVGLGTPVDWANVEFEAAGVNMYLGDFNSDGAVNHYDLALWIPHVLSSPGDGNFDPMFDLNADSRVDAADLAILMPRLYRPVDGQPAQTGLAASGVPAGRIGSAPWDAAAGDDLDWVDSLPALRPHQRHARRQTVAVDHVLQGFDPRFSI